MVGIILFFLQNLMFIETFQQRNINFESFFSQNKRSQCMYMYYLLGHRLMELPISVDRKETLAENTYILTLDGDIDFQPPAVSLLVDLMKKNRNLGAACGRIHPVGSGPMVWYQVNKLSTIE